MRQVTILLIVLVLAMLVFKWGRSLYMPVVQKLKGKLSLEEVEQRLGSQVKSSLGPDLTAAGFSSFPVELYLLAFKEEQKLEVYGEKDNSWQFIKAYPFTAFSGILGPKLKEGDKQIPEGLYQVEYLNPNSSYYLSMKIDYPNDFDKSKAESSGREDLGSDIFIHGKAVSVGCIPIGDEAMEELFIMTIKTTSQRPKVMILPRDFRSAEKYPLISGVDWVEELYGLLDGELDLFR